MPADHLLRSIDRFVDLSDIRAHLRPVNAGRILGQCGGVKAGHSWRGGEVCKKAPDRGPFCKSASASGVRLGAIPKSALDNARNG